LKISDSKKFLESLLLWPFDEVKLVKGLEEGTFKIDSPWLKLSLQSTPEQSQILEALSKKFQDQSLNGEDLPTLRDLFSPLLKYPFVYFLARQNLPSENLDQHTIVSGSFLKLQPQDFVSAVTKDFKASGSSTPDFRFLHLDLKNREWLWDLESALEFSKLSSGFDPLSLLSVARRYGLVESHEHSDTASLFTQVIEMKNKQSDQSKMCAAIVRQNHFVTLQCQSSLEPALQKAQRARIFVDEFVSAEQGHDKLLERALTSMGLKATDVPVVPASYLLMDLLRVCAERNFLAFSIAVDIFERSSYREEDPLAELLKSSGFADAAKQINIHKNINDSGDHENESLEFLQFMGPVDRDYAEEAFRMAELISFTVQRVSKELSDLAVS